MPSIAFATSTLHIKPSLSNKTAKFYDLISKSFTFEIYVNSFMLLKSFLQDFGLQFYILSNAFFESNLHVIWRSLCITFACQKHKHGFSYYRANARLNGLIDRNGNSQNERLF